MKKGTTVITLIALLIIGGLLGYIRNQYTIQNHDNTTNSTNNDDANELRALIENSTNTPSPTNTDNLGSGSTANNETTSTGNNQNTGDTLENEKNYEPLIINHDDTDAYDQYPNIDQTFEAALSKSGSSTPHIVRENQTTEALTQAFKLQGTISNDVERIDVIREGDMEPFTLQKFIPGTSSFEYNFNAEYGNLQEGTNYYLIRGYASDTIYQKIIEVEYDPAPSTDDLDQAYRS